MAKAKSIIPTDRPKISRAEIEAMLKAQNFDLSKHKICIVGIRGYYKKSMGDPTKNDIGIYDDACAVISENEFATFNFNTDPSALAYGRGMVIAGLYFSYCIDVHNGRKSKYPAVCQRLGKVKLKRHGMDGIFEGYFGANMHKGGINETSSEACQTIPTTQYDSFFNLVCKIVDKNLKKGQTRYDFVIPYLLVDN